MHDRGERKADESGTGRPPRATVSAVLIVKNEEAVIGRCLDTLGWADEIVVLDSGSTDRTVEIARQRGARVAVRSDWAGYGIQRQRAQALATGDYIFAIDADEVVTPELQAAIEGTLKSPDDGKVYEVRRFDWFLGAFLNRNWRQQTHVRLYCRTKYSYNDNLVHESVDNRGAGVVRLKGALLHYTCCDYQFFLEKHVKYAHAWARDQAAHGKRSSLAGALFHALWSFLRLYVFQGGFLDGAYGLVFAIHFAHYVFHKHAALWHHTRMSGAAERGNPAASAPAATSPQAIAPAAEQKSAA
jgi:(heptosyl)LPS beta-1,4-glucosyltransferase